MKRANSAINVTKLISYMSMWLILFTLVYSCKNASVQESNQKIVTPYDAPPEWARDAIWYQIFVERFWNGNPANDPTLETVHNSLIDSYPNTWQVTPWTHNWYEQEDWGKITGLDFYRTIQMRRYGGDLEGVMAKLDYIEDLGINAIYFNPLNDAASLHKYDARHYHHIDITFGGSIDRNLEIMAREDPGDPSTWQWTEADLYFLDLVKELHRRGIKVVLDYSFNHTGRSFWAFEDLVKNQANSQYKDWYEVKSFADPATKTTFEYEGWFGIKELPELKKFRQTPKIQGHAYEGNMPDVVKDHIFAVCKRWMDPNGDGDVSDGIDGMRLDVAEHVPLGFWRDFRKYVRSVNPNFYLVGENWWKEWPDHLMDVEPWVQGDIFDAVMHYHWYKPARGLFNKGEDGLNVSEFQQKIFDVYGKYRVANAQAMMNLTSSHDSPRFWTSISNSGKYKHHCKPTEDPMYNTRTPNPITILEGKALLLHQFTMIGSPHIWNGDEMGMAGSDDPDNRKPLWWPDLDFDIETPSSYSNLAYRIKPAFNHDIHQYYKSLVSLRKSKQTFSRGTYEPFMHDQFPEEILCYDRVWNGEKVRVMINITPHTLIIHSVPQMGVLFEQEVHRTSDTYQLKPYGGVVFEVLQQK